MYSYCKLRVNLRVNLQSPKKVTPHKGLNDCFSPSESHLLSYKQSFREKKPSYGNWSFAKPASSLQLGCPRCFQPVLIHGSFMNSSLGHRRRWTRHCRPALLSLWGFIFLYPVLERRAKNFAYSDPCSGVACFQSEKMTVKDIVDTLIRDKVVLLPRYWNTEYAELARKEVHEAVQECRA